MLEPADVVDGLAAARELHRRGVAESTALRPAAAERLLTAALRAVDSADVDGVATITLRMQILITLAKVESELRGSQVGLARLDQAAELLDRKPDPQVVVALHNQRGVLMARFGRFGPAIDEFDTAETYFDTAAPLEQANVLLNRATVSMLLGDLRPAAADLERCAMVARDGELPMLQYMSLHNLGYLEFLRGDLPRALRTMDEAADLGTGLNGVALLDRARVLVEAGLIREADDVLSEAAEILRRDRLAQDLAETELERARCALIGGDVASARRFAGRARDRFRRRGSDAWRRTAELVLLQADLAAGRPGRRLVAPARRLRSELDAEGLRAQARTACLIAAEACLSFGDTAAARELLAGIGSVSRGDPITARLHQRYVEARTDAGSRTRRSASRKVRLGLEELAAYQGSFGSIDLQTAAAIHGRRLAELGLSLALETGAASAVFTVAEQARAVSTRLAVVRPPRDPQAADLLAELRQTVDLLRSAAQDREGSARLLRRRRELEAAISARGWSVSGGGAARPIVGLDEIRAAVEKADSTMAVFVEAGGELSCVLVGPDGVRLRALGPADAINEQVRRTRADLDVLAQSRLPGPLSEAVRRSLRRSLELLDGVLGAPLGGGTRRLVIISTGILGQLPWNALPSLRGVPVVVASSATSWLAAAAPGTRARRRSVFGLAGPDLDRADHEVARIMEVWGSGTAASGTAASRGALAAALGRASIAHVAAHGLHQTENAMFSSLRLADGVMFAHELDQSARTPEHVILSACELGLATVRPGDEALGLTSVLLRLGTRSVIAGVARVGDDVAAETMIDYHRRLSHGQDSAAALADAMSASDAIAPFVCFGASWQPPGFGASRTRRVP